MASRMKDRAGEIHGKLTVLRFDRKDTKHRTFWLCDCSCGNQVSVRLDMTRQSCGCVRAEKNRFRSVGKYRNDASTNTKLAYLATARRVYKLYNDSSELTFEEFLELTSLNCHYCNNPPSNSTHLGFTKEGKPKTHNRRRKNGEAYMANNSYSKYPEAIFVYSGLDRIDQTQLHTRHNVVPCCKTCNFMKRDMNQISFLSHISQIFNHTETK